jgi:carbonic anhydrase
VNFVAIDIKILQRGDEGLLTNTANGTFDDPIDARSTAEFLGDPRHHLVVAREDGLIVGFVSAVHYLHPDKPHPELWINEVDVAETHRERGIGKALLRSLLDVAREMGCTEAWVLTDRSNTAAMRLYSSAGGVEAPHDQVMFTFRLNATGDTQSEDRKRQRFDVRTISPHDSLDRLREGNRRFVANMRSRGAYLDEAKRAELVEGQQPFAIVLGCSDSRVPVEYVFDQGFGDLFVIRVAGNIVAPSQIDSVEFAAERFGTRVVVVLGHSRCGAVVATLEELRRPDDGRSRSLRSIVDRVRPAVEGLLATELRHDQDALVRDAVRANIRTAVDHLRHGSETLRRLIQNDGLLIVGAEYSLETGVVDFFDDVPEAG